MARWWSLALVALLSGCASPDGRRSSDDGSASEAPGAVPPATVDPWQGRDRILVASQDWDAGTFSLDILCAFGGAWYVPRTGELVLAGTASFEVTVETGPFYTGLQVGLQHEDDEVLWLEAVANERRTFSVKVLPEQWESEDDKGWTFWYRDTVDGNPELCYSGAAVGERTVAIEALKA